MTMRWLFGWVVAWTALASTPGFAGALKKVPPALNPAKAYVIVEVGKVDDGLLFGTLVLSRYDAERKDIAETTPPTATKPSGKGEPLEFRVSLLKPAVKAGDHNLYIAEIDPGLWVVEGANDTAFSLGSNMTQLAAGSVTDIGVVSVYSDFPEGEKRDVVTSGRLLKGALMGGIFGKTLPTPMPKAIEIRAREGRDIPIPQVFARLVRPVEWAGEVRFGNHLGGMVNRMGGRKARAAAQPAK